MAAKRKVKKAKKKAAKKRGRPRIVVDLGIVEELAGMQCTDAEIAAALHVSPALITTRKHDDADFLNAYTKGRETGKSSLRRMQWRSAGQGSFAMQIWLGKQYLGQQDKQQTQIEGLNLPALLQQVGAMLGEFIREFVPPERWDDARAKIKALNATADQSGRGDTRVH